MSEGLIFANARAKAKEGNLISEERILRMMECVTVDDAVRILSEVNYAGGLTGDFYDLLKEEERLVTNFVRETAPEKSGFDCFFLCNDYHNMKVLLKAKETGNTDYKSQLLPEGNYKISFLSENIEKEHSDLPVFAIHALKEIEKSKTDGTFSPRKIDVEMDKAMFKDIVSRLKNADKTIKDYFISLIDSTNVLTFVRCVRAGGGYKMFAENFIGGGQLLLDKFPSDGDLQKLYKNLYGTPYLEFLHKSDDGGIACFETAQDDLLLKIFRENRIDMFSVAPIVGYYLGKLTEIKVIRVVLVCIKNGISAEEMRKRVRALYVK